VIDAELLHQQNQKLVADYEALGSEHDQLKKRYQELDKLFEELNADWVKRGNQEWLFKNQLRLKEEELEEQQKMKDEILEQVHKENLELRERVAQLEAVTKNSPWTDEKLKQMVAGWIEQLDAKKVGWTRNGCTQLILGVRALDKMLNSADEDN
jgi:chromosome segregation ATPase